MGDGGDGSPARTSCSEKGRCVSIELRGIVGLLILIADVWAIVNIAQSGASTGKKVLWIVLVLVLPVLGLVLWFLLGPRTGKA